MFHVEHFPRRQCSTWNNPTVLADVPRGTSFFCPLFLVEHRFPSHRGSANPERRPATARNVPRGTSVSAAYPVMNIFFLTLCLHAHTGFFSHNVPRGT